MVSDDTGRVAVLLDWLGLRRLREVTQGIEVLVLIVHVELFIIEVFLEFCLIILVSVPLRIVSDLPSQERLTCFSYQSFVVNRQVVWLSRKLIMLFRFPFLIRLIRNHKQLIRLPFLLSVLSDLLSLSFEVLSPQPCSLQFSIFL